MARNRIFYGLFLLAAVVFHSFYTGWFSFFLLLFSVLLPVFSLLVSLPAMLRAAYTPQLPLRCFCGQDAQFTLQPSSAARLPVSCCRLHLLVCDAVGGTQQAEWLTLAGTLRFSLRVDTRHAGQQTFRVDRARVYDALGLVGLPLQLREGLRERSYGAFQGHDSTEIETLFPDAYAAWQTRDPGFAPEGGESQRELYHRVLHALEPIVGAHPGGRIACVAHGGVLDCVYRFANGIELSAPRNYPLLNTSINVVDYVDGRAQVVQWADVSHLEAASDDDDGYRKVL